MYNYELAKGGYVMKWFCPWCGLELESNQAGATHIHPVYAWNQSECEYQVGDVSKHFEVNYPISELQRTQNSIKVLELRRKGINRDLKGFRLKAEELQKEWDQTYGNTNKN